MRKAVVHGPRDLRLDEVPDPKPGPGEVLIRIRRSSVCHTDVNTYLGARPTIRFPTGFCHDASGTVAALGPGVEDLTIGLEVTPGSRPGCGVCRMCRAGIPTACIQAPAPGPDNHAPEWAAELVVLPRNRVLPLPAGVSLDDAAVLEPLQTALNSPRRLGYQAGDQLLILGTGSMGWGQIQVAKLHGLRVAGIDMLPERLEMGRRFGLELALKADAPDVEEQLRAWAPEGIPYVIDATGTGRGVQRALELAGRGAKIGFLAAPDPIVAHALVTKQAALFGLRTAGERMEALHLIAAGKLDFKPAISHRYPFSRIVEAMAHAADAPREVTKCVLEY